MKLVIENPPRRDKSGRFLRLGTRRKGATKVAKRKQKKTTTRRRSRSGFASTNVLFSLAAGAAGHVAAAQVAGRIPQLDTPIKRGLAKLALGLVGGALAAKLTRSRAIGTAVTIGAGTAGAVEVLQAATGRSLSGYLDLSPGVAGYLDLAPSLADIPRLAPSLNGLGCSRDLDSLTY